MLSELSCYAAVRYRRLMWKTGSESRFSTAIISIEIGRFSLSTFKAANSSASVPGENIRELIKHGVPGTWCKRKSEQMEI